MHSLLLALSYTIQFDHLTYALIKIINLTIIHYARITLGIYFNSQLIVNN